MALSSPRIPPVSVEDMAALAAELEMNPGQGRLNVTRTMAQHPALVKARMPSLKRVEFLVQARFQSRRSPARREVGVRRALPRPPRMPAG